MEEQIKELQEQLLEKEKQIVISEHKAVTAREKLLEATQFPEIARQSAQLEYDLKLARQFVASKAFPHMTPEQAYVLMKAGQDLGLTPMQSIGSLYIVNGAVGFWGAGLVAQLTKNGVVMSYEDESVSGVTVVATYKGAIFKEVVTDKDQILQKSKAMQFAKKNKMRYHGVRMLATFHFPHMLSGLSVWEPDDIEAAKELQKGEEYFDIKELIEAATTVAELEAIMTEHKKELTNPRNIDLLAVYGRVKKEFETAEQL